MYSEIKEGSLVRTRFTISVPLGGCEFNRCTIPAGTCGIVSRILNRHGYGIFRVDFEYGTYNTVEELMHGDEIVKVD